MRRRRETRSQQTRSQQTRPQAGPGTGGVAAFVVAVVALVGATLLPWVRSGSRDRSSYELAALGDRLAVDGAAAAALGAWQVVPAVVGVLVALAVLGRPRGAALGAVLVALVTTAVACAVEIAPLATGPGPRVAVIAAVAVLAVSLHVAGVPAAVRRTLARSATPTSEPVPELASLRRSRP